MTKTLREVRLMAMPFFPRIIPGKVTTHAKAIELSGISDQVRTPEIARSHIRHTAIPIKSAVE